MASCNLSYSGHTGVINAEAYVYEITTSGTTRTVQVVLDVYAIDYSGARDGGYSVYCRESGTNISVPSAKVTGTSPGCIGTSSLCASKS